MTAHPDIATAKGRAVLALDEDKPASPTSVRN